MEPEAFPGGQNITTKEGLIHYLRENKVIKSEEVAEIMNTIDRALFVPPGPRPYVNSVQPLGYKDAAISSPVQHAICLELLKDHLRPGMKVLDIGSGSGYMTACFAVMVGGDGLAVGVEQVPELIHFSVENISKTVAAPLLGRRSLSFVCDDGTEGLAAFAPYDAIHFGGLAEKIYSELTNQLKYGGRLVIPVRGDDPSSGGLTVVDKKADGTLHEWIKYRVLPNAVMDRENLNNRP